MTKGRVGVTKSNFDACNRRGDGHEQKYARRQLGSNADRYVESEPELDSDGTSPPPS